MKYCDLVTSLLSSTLWCQWKGVDISITFHYFFMVKIVLGCNLNYFHT